MGFWTRERDEAIRETQDALHALGRLGGIDLFHHVPKSKSALERPF